MEKLNARAKRIAYLEGELQSLANKLRECCEWHKERRDNATSDLTRGYHEGMLTAQRDAIRSIELI